MGLLERFCSKSMVSKLCPVAQIFGLFSVPQAKKFDDHCSKYSKWIISFISRLKKITKNTPESLQIVHPPKHPIQYSPSPLFRHSSTP
jgi:hypothetical protein